MSQARFKLSCEVTDGNWVQAVSTSGSCRIETSAGEIKVFSKPRLETLNGREEDVLSLLFALSLSMVEKERRLAWVLMILPLGRR
jgi:hypothetical protein